ncbi:MAG TPA: hypothetical protein VH880_00835 [Anaeromyxobacteraceae bacterium]
MRTMLALRSLAAAAALAVAGSASAQARPAAEPNDGERVVGRWGVAYFGQSQFDFSLGAVTNILNVHTVGVRKWMPTSGTGFYRNWGLDAGVGLALGGGSDKTGGVSVDAPSAFGLALHGGLPLAIAHSRHVTFELIPEANLVYASSTVTGAGGAQTDFSGWALQLGARAGFEVFFGFIGVPQLALEATLGASLGYVSTKVKPTGVAETTSTRWMLATSRQNEPWSIFGGNVAAIYYF